MHPSSQSNNDKDSQNKPFPPPFRTCCHRARWPCRPCGKAGSQQACCLDFPVLESKKDGLTADTMKTFIACVTDGKRRESVSHNFVKPCKR